MAQEAATTGQARRGAVVTTLGSLQILAWGSTFYLLAVLAKPITPEIGWPYDRVMGGLALGAWLPAPSRRALAAASPDTAAASFSPAAGAAGVGSGTDRHGAEFCCLSRRLGHHGRRYGRRSLRCCILDARLALRQVGARRDNSGVLLGGFASTVCWPLSAVLVEHLGWRGACLTYAGIHSSWPVRFISPSFRRRGATMLRMCPVP